MPDGRVVDFEVDVSGYDNLRQMVKKDVAEGKIECIGEPASGVEEPTWIRYSEVCQILFDRSKSIWIANGEGLRRKVVGIREISSSYGRKYQGYTFAEALHLYAKEDAEVIRARWDEFRKQHGRKV